LADKNKYNYAQYSLKMPVTPRFTLSQDSHFVFLTVNAPYVRAGDAEVVVDSNTVHFYCRPYLLRLSLPGECVDDERLRVAYDVDSQSGSFSITIPKAVQGEEFKDLDMLTLLAMPGGGHRATAGSADMKATFTTSTRAGAGAGAEEMPYLSKPARSPDDDGSDDDDEDRLLDSLDAAAAQRAYDEREEENLRKLVEEQLIATASKQGGAKQASLQRKLQALRSKKRDPAKPLIEVLANEDFDDEAGVDSADGHTSSSIEGNEQHQESKGKGEKLISPALSSDKPEPEIVVAPSSSAPLSTTATLSNNPISAAPLQDRGVGFNRRFDPLVFFKDLAEDAPLIVDLPHPEYGYSSDERAALREAYEDEHFDPARYASDSLLRVVVPAAVGAASSAGNYVGVSGYETDGLRRRRNDDDDDEDDKEDEEDDEDLREDPILTEAFTMIPWWMQEMGRVLTERSAAAMTTTGGSNSSSDSKAAVGSFTWTERETSDLLSLAQQQHGKRSELMLDGIVLGASSPSSATLSYNPRTHPETTCFLTCLAGVLFAYTYDHRTTGGEEGGNVESPWTVRTLCPLLSWLDDTCDSSSTLGKRNRHAADTTETEADEEEEDGEKQRLADLLRVVSIQPKAGETAADINKKKGPLIVPVDEETEAKVAGRTAVPSSSSSSSPALLSGEPAPTSPSPAADAFVPSHLQPMLVTASACVRRSLTFPYLRRWDLSLLCLSDAATIMMCGKRACLRVLLCVRRYLMSANAGDGGGGGASSDSSSSSSMHYLLNTLWVNDAIVALQTKVNTATTTTGGGIEGWDQLLMEAGSALSTLIQPRPSASTASTSSSFLPPYLSKSLSPYLSRWRLEELEANAEGVIETAATSAAGAQLPLGVAGVDALLESLEEEEEGDEEDSEDEESEEEEEDDEEEDVDN
jgi:SHQ1 protein